MSVGGVDFCFR